MIMKKQFNYNEVPTWWALCFNENCPRKGECMRFVAGQHVPDDKTIGQAVYPNACKNGTCEHFYQLRVVRAARGFGNIFAEVKQKDAAVLREKIMKHLGGHGSYYRYKNGERLLMPEQQDWICQLFERYGYADMVTFLEYMDVYDLEG